MTETKKCSRHYEAMQRKRCQLERALVGKSWKILTSKYQIHKWINGDKREFFQMNKCRRSDWIRKSPFVKHQWILTSVGKSLIRNWLVISFQSSSPCILLTKRKGRPIQWRHLANPTLIKWPKIISAITEQLKVMDHLVRCEKENRAYLRQYLCKSNPPE